MTSHIHNEITNNDTTSRLCSCSEDSNNQDLVLVNHIANGDERSDRNGDFNGTADMATMNSSVEYNPKNPIIKSCSESDLRILSNPHNRHHSNNSSTTKSRSNMACCSKIIAPIRSDYVTIAAASKRGKSRGLHSFRKQIIHQNSLLCGHTDTQRGTNTIVVIPSIDLDGDELKRICPNIEFYEERQLYHLLLLSDPSFRVVFLSTHPICEDIVRYYLTLDNCSCDELRERRQRLFLLTPGDWENSQSSSSSSASSLSKRVVNHDKLISTIREIVDRISGGMNPSAGLNVFCGSDTADKLASKLKLRLLEAGGEQLYYGSKQGRYDGIEFYLLHSRFFFCTSPSIIIITYMI